MDLYRPILEKALFPALEAARGRPTVSLLRYLQSTETWSPDALRDLQAGLLPRLISHAYAHTADYSTLLGHFSMRPDDFQTVADLRPLPLLDRELANRTLDERTSTAPPY